MGNIPQTPQPINPRKKLLLLSFLTVEKFLIRLFKLNKNNIKKKIAHLQKESEIGGTYSIPPRATIKLLAINKG
jgi:hypothetical protein